MLQKLPLFSLPLISDFPRIAMETYIRQRQLIMSPLITSHVIGENEPLTSVLNKVIAAKEVNHKGQGTQPCISKLGGAWGSGIGIGSLDLGAFPCLSLMQSRCYWRVAYLSFLLKAFNTEEHQSCTQHRIGSQLYFVNSVGPMFIPWILS